MPMFPITFNVMVNLLSFEEEISKLDDDRAMEFELIHFKHQLDCPFLFDNDTIRL